MMKSHGEIAVLPEETILQVYMLGEVDFEAGLRLQRRLHYEISGDRKQTALILCEHPPLITVGRQGSRAHILCEAQELRARRWRVRWVNRGGGTLLHVPGQLALYPIVPLERFGLGLDDYLQRLVAVGLALLADFDIEGAIHPEIPGIQVGGRLIAAAGVAVRDWVATFGLYLNINPALDLFRQVRWGGPHEAPMTSLERERRGRVRPALVRQRLVEHFANHFACGRQALFSDHPTLNGSGQRAQGVPTPS
jgi:lipoyl(octanoyl) transferase